MDDQLQRSIARWVREMGNTPTTVADRDAAWHIQFQYPVNSTSLMHVVVPRDQPDAAVIAMGVNVGVDHQAGFERLDDEAKATFNWELLQRLNNIDVEFKVEGVTTGHECPTAYQVMRTRYLDGLTKDGFAFSAGAVYKTWLKGLWFIQKELGPPTGGAGGRFDFKRLGI